jgi:hypothetical protein
MWGMRSMGSAQLSCHARVVVFESDGGAIGQFHAREDLKMGEGL